MNQRMSSEPIPKKKKQTSCKVRPGVLQSRSGLDRGRQQEAEEEQHCQEGAYSSGTSDLDIPFTEEIASVIKVMPTEKAPARWVLWSLLQEMSDILKKMTPGVLELLLAPNGKWWCLVRQAF